MAKKSSNRWAMSNWTAGPTTLANALGLTALKIKIPSLSAQLPGAVSTANAPASSSGTASAASSSGGVAPSNSSEKAFWTAVLQSLGAPANSANINSLQAWASHESVWPGGPNKGGLYNPLNTTLSLPGATSYNSVNVRNYLSPAQGVQATVETLKGGYPGIVSALKSGKGVCGGGLAAEFNKWSNNGYGSVC